MNFIISIFCCLRTEAIPIAYIEKDLSYDTQTAHANIEEIILQLMQSVIEGKYQSVGLSFCDA